MKQEKGGAAGLWHRHKTAGVASIILAVALVLSLIAEASFAVPLVFAVLFVEGDIIVYLLIAEGRSRKPKEQDAGFIAEPEVPRYFYRTDRTQSLVTLVKWAAKGSEYSRREIALSLAHIIGNESSLGKQVGGFSSGAVSAILLPYKDDLVMKESLTPRGENAVFGKLVASKRGRVGRGRYLTSLEELVSNMEREADLSERRDVVAK